MISKKRMIFIASEVSYALRWNKHRGRPGQTPEEEEARRRFTEGEEFTVALPTANEKTWPILITCVLKNKLIMTSFLGEQERKEVEYNYIKEDDKWMFLSKRKYWGCPNDNPKLDIPEAYRVEAATQRKDGYTKREIINKKIIRTP